jgi:hypothetical protein
MGFENVSLLFGAAAAVIPVILHLILRQKPKRVEFPALQFLKKRHEATSRKLRLRHLLLLLMRMAVLGFLAAALARPTMKAAGIMANQEAPVAAAIVVDTSPRMDYRHENKTRLEVAREFADWLVSQLPRQSHVAVLESRLNSAVFQVDLAAARRRIERLSTSSAAQPLPAVIVEGLRLLETSDRQRREVYVLTDFSRAAWVKESGQSIPELVKKLGEVGVYVIDVGVKDPQNFSLADIRLSSQVVSQTSSVTISTSLARLGKAEERAVELVTLDENRKESIRGHEKLQVEPGGAAAVSFSLGDLEAGTHQGMIRIVGEDGLAADDRRYFTVEARPPWNVLLAAPEPTADSSLFVLNALAPEAFRKTGQVQFQCEVVGYKALDEKPLDSFDAVCLIDPHALPRDTWQRLSTFVMSRRGLGVFLGRRASPARVFNESGAIDVLPGPLAMQARGDNALAPATYDRPLMAHFRPLEGQIPWDAFPVYRYWQLEELVAGCDVIIPYSDGRPALIERRLGEGKVLCLTTPVSDWTDDDPWNLLPTGTDPWPFVMLANEMLMNLVGTSDGVLNCNTGSSALLLLDQDQPVASYLLTTPTGEELRKTTDPTRRELAITTTEWPGHYRVRTGGAGSPSRGFSVNLSPSLTDLARLEPDELKGLFQEVEYRVADSPEQIKREVREGRVGHELFPLLMLLVALILGGEHLVANLFYRDPPAPAP